MIIISIIIIAIAVCAEPVSIICWLLCRCLPTISDCSSVNLFWKLGGRGS